MKSAPTLADMLIRESFNPQYKRLGVDMALFRNQLATARKFVLDDAMSAFMADLAYASLPMRRNIKRDAELMDGLRLASRLPHKLTWIEFNLRERFGRACSEYGVRTSHGVSSTPKLGGWLCAQHPQIETAFFALECTSQAIDTDKTLTDVQQPNFMKWAWQSIDEEPLPWRCFLPKKEGKPTSSEVLTGIRGYASDQVGIIWNDMFPINKVTMQTAMMSMSECASDLRYLWSLLATINDLPISRTDVKADKGYVARGSYRKFVDHTLIHLKVPAPRHRRLAMKVIAISRRKRHEVRGHWRQDHWRPGERIWIKEHERGDASLGFVTHEYAVERGSTT